MCFDHQDAVSISGRVRRKFVHKLVVNLGGGILIGWKEDSILCRMFVLALSW